MMRRGAVGRAWLACSASWGWWEDGGGCDALAAGWSGRRQGRIALVDGRANGWMGLIGFRRTADDSWG